MATPEEEIKFTCKVIYEQDGVFIHTSSLHKDEDVLAAGKITVTEKSEGVFLEWHAVSQMEYSLEHGHGANDQEWAMINTVGYKPNKLNDGSIEIKGFARHKFDINFSFDDLKSFKCFKPAQGWAHMIFILKDGVTYPAVHFHCGGCPELIEVMEKYITINRSTKDPNLYLVVSALEKAFNDLQLFKETSTDFVSRLYTDPYTTALNSFSKVTNLLYNTFAPVDHISGLEVLPPSLLEKDVIQHIDPDFVLISSMKLGPKPVVTRQSPLTLNQWISAMDPEGRIKDFDSIKKIIFSGHITHSLRSEVWKFLLGYYKPSLTSKSRKEEQKQKKDDYFRMKLQWKSMSDDQLSRFCDLSEKMSLIEKDIRRTDRSHPFFAGDDNQNLSLMKDILTTYCMYNFDLGYVQGMSDILSPLLVVMQEEVDSFWCFVGFMNRIGSNFKMDQEAMKRQFFDLRTILHYVNTDLNDYLDTHDASHLTFCFPWILILFKREFSFPDIMKLWEVLWTDLPCKNFHLLMCAVILEAEQTTIMENSFGLTEIVKHINDISQTIDLEDVLKKSEGLFLQLKECPELPLMLQKILNINVSS